MSEVILTRLRRAILQQCQSHHGTLERKWDADGLAKKAIGYLLREKLLRREVGDGPTSFVYRLITTERGVKALRGDVVNQL